MVRQDPKQPAMGAPKFTAPDNSPNLGARTHGGRLAFNDAGPPDGSLLYYNIITCARFIINANEKLLLDRENNKGNYSYTLSEESVLAAVLASSPRREVPEDSLTEGDGKPLWG